MNTPVRRLAANDRAQCRSGAVAAQERKRAAAGLFEPVGATESCRLEQRGQAGARARNEIDDLGPVGRVRDQVALHRHVAAVDEEVELARTLDALDRNLQSEAATQRDD